MALLPTDQSNVSLGYFSQDVSPCTAVTVTELQRTYSRQRALSLAVNLSMDKEDLLLSEGDEDLAFSSTDSCYSADSQGFSASYHDLDNPSADPQPVSKERCDSSSRYTKLRRQTSVSEEANALCETVSHKDILAVDFHHNEEDDASLKRNLTTTLTTPQKQKLVLSIKDYTPAVNKQPDNLIDIIEEQKHLGETFPGQISTRTGPRRRLHSILQSLDFGVTRSESRDTTNLQENDLLLEPWSAQLPTHSEYDVTSPMTRSIHSSSSSSHLLCTRNRGSKEAYIRSLSLSSDRERTKSHKRRNFLRRLFHSFSRLQLSSRQSSRQSSRESDSEQQQPDSQSELEAKGITLALI